MFATRQLEPITRHGHHIIATALFLACSLTFAASAGGTIPQAPLPNFSATYEVSRNGIKLGESSRVLRRGANGQFIYESQTHATGFVAWLIKDLIVERSVWIPAEHGLRPLSYSYDRSGGRKERHVKLHFDWENLRVTNDIGGDIWRMTIPADAYDKLIYQLAIMHDLSQGRETLQYNIADGGKLKNYEFEILGRETIETKLGPLKTVKIRRIDKKRDTVIWCATALNYLPVRLDQREPDGARFSMELLSVEGFGPAAAVTSQK
ncbi:MAG TPA: DUF3108 domain-containing protein [Gammaproteobacteria bacterium]|nr:DUF3108 domain-containing protein [Gammaproteobacteria bacterium]